MNGYANPKNEGIQNRSGGMYTETYEISSVMTTIIFIKKIILTRAFFTVLIFYFLRQYKKSAWILYFKSKDNTILSFLTADHPVFPVDILSQFNICKIF